MVCSDLCCAVCSLHMLARQYSILLARQRKLNTRKYLIIASIVNTYIKQKVSTKASKKAFNYIDLIIHPLDVSREVCHKSLEA